MNKEKLMNIKETKALLLERYKARFMGALETTFTKYFKSHPELRKHSSLENMCNSVLLMNVLQSSLIIEVSFRQDFYLANLAVCNNFFADLNGLTTSFSEKGLKGVKDSRGQFWFRYRSGVYQDIKPQLVLPLEAPF